MQHILQIAAEIVAKAFQAVALSTMAQPAPEPLPIEPVIPIRQNLDAFDSLHISPSQGRQVVEREINGRSVIFLIDRTTTNP
jgi:hypothetical protein